MKVGLTASAFDLLHAGQVSMLREAKDQCDYLICALDIDPSRDREEKNKPAQSVVERQIQLEAVKYVDEVVCYDSEKALIDIIELKQIDVRILGEEYKDRDFTGRERCETLGIELYFNKRNHRFSSSELRNRIKKIE